MTANLTVLTVGPICQSKKEIKKLRKKEKIPNTGSSSPRPLPGEQLRREELACILTAADAGDERRGVDGVLPSDGQEARRVAVATGRRGLLLRGRQSRRSAEVAAPLHPPPVRRWGEGSSGATDPPALLAVKIFSDADAADVGGVLPGLDEAPHGSPGMLSLGLRLPCRGCRLW